MQQQIIINKEQSIIQTINLVMTDLAAIGIGKDRVNEMQRYNFRGIDDVYNAIANLYSKHGLVVLPQVLEYSREIGQTSKGTPQVTVTQHVQFTFHHIHNEQTVITTQWGEAADTSDKATNKASSAAYKYMAIESFAIPIVGNDDADNSHPEVTTSKDKNVTTTAPKKEPTPSLEDNKKGREALCQEIVSLFKAKGLTSEQVKADDGLVKLVKHIDSNFVEASLPQLQAMKKFLEGNK